MTTFRIAIFTFVSSALFLPSVALAWTIDSFDATIEVFEDATFRVEEVIQVDFTESKHGIFRNIPTSYRDPLGNRVTIDLSDIVIEQDGEPATVVDYRSGGDRVFQIGDGDVTLSGPHEYILRYTVDRAFLYFDEYDELYWNVTGDNWEVPITASSAVVILPDGTEVKQSACYTGYFGSTLQNCGTATEGSLVAFAAEDYLTVAVGFEKGIVDEPTKQQRVLWFLQDNWLAVIPLLIMVFTLVIWWRLGRDPRMETVVAEFEPPDDIWAAYAGALVRHQFTSADIAGMIVQMAVKGYLSFEVEGKGFRRHVTLHKKSESEGLDTAHKVLFDHLFSGRTSVTDKQLKRSASTSTMSSIRKAINSELERRKIFVPHSKRRRTVMIVFAVILFYFTMFSGAFFGFFTAALFFASSVIMLIFGMLMPKKTLHGVAFMRKVLGFKLFMHTAERYRSQWQEEQHLFEEFLPYAIVFGDTKRWAKTFANIEFKNPSWYQGTQAFVAADVFSKDILSVATSTVRSAAPSSSSSGGSSGGGFSGGGFGGGGGGSW